MQFYIFYSDKNEFNHVTNIFISIIRLSIIIIIISGNDF